MFGGLHRYKMKLLFILCGCISLILYEVHAYKTGAPARACASMKPGHGVEPQTTVAPYKLTVEPQNGHFKVSIMAQPGDFFRGFFLQVRESENRDKMVNGEFSSTENARFADCDGGERNAITHVINSNKTKIITTWTPPAGYEGNVIFRATVVRTAKVFWTGIDSEPFPIYSSPSIFQNRAKNANHFSSIYEKCYTKGGCLGLPPNCIENKACLVLVSFVYNTDKNVIEFEISKKISPNYEGWIAAGISSDNIMGSDSVADCIYAEGNALFQYSWNEGKSHKALEKIPQIQGVSATAADGILNCVWTRELQTIENGIHFDLINHNYYILLAEGNLKSVSPLVQSYHNYRMPSGTPVNLTSIRNNRSGRRFYPYVRIRAHGVIGSFFVTY